MCQVFVMTDKKLLQLPTPTAWFDWEQNLTNWTSQLDEPTGRQILADMTDHVRASLSEQKSVGKPDQSL